MPKANISVRFAYLHFDDIRYWQRTGIRQSGDWTLPPRPTEVLEKTSLRSAMGAGFRISGIHQRPVRSFPWVS